MTETTAPASVETTPAPAAKVADWARFEPAKPAAPAPQYLSTPEINAITDHAQLTAALRQGNVGWMNKDVALQRLGVLLQEQVGHSVPTREVIVSQAADLPDSSALPATAAEQERMATLEREAFTAPPGLISDYTVPGDISRDPETMAINQGIRASLFAAQVPVPVANTVLTAAHAIAQQIAGLDDEEAASFADTRSQVVRDHFKAQWGADFEPRITKVKAYLKAAADKAHAAGQPMLRQILTNSPELLDDPASIQVLWEAASRA